MGIFAILPLASCNQDKDRTVSEQERVATLAAFRPVSYHRSGGLSGSDERINIDEKGNLEISGKFFGNDKGVISEYQKLQLTRQFAGWESLSFEYRPATPIADGYITQIRHGDKSITVYDGAKDVPELFIRARERLEQIARQARGSKG